MRATARRRQSTSETRLAVPISPPARLSASVPPRTGQPVPLVVRRPQLHALSVAVLIRGGSLSAGAAATISRLTAGHRRPGVQP
jgi:hypothetical protein